MVKAWAAAMLARIQRARGVLSNASGSDFEHANGWDESSQPDEIVEVAGQHPHLPEGSLGDDGSSIELAVWFFDGHATIVSRE